MVNIKKGMLFEAVAVLLLIFLVFVLYVMVTTRPSTSEQWTLSGVIGNTIYGNMFVGDDGTLYTVDGKNIHSIDADGRLRWSLEIPYMLNGGYVEAWRGQRAVTDNGTLYIELFPTNMLVCEELLAISPDGKLKWGKAYTATGFPVFIYAKKDRLYVRYPENLTVYGADGRVAWYAPNVRYIPAIDENGTSYMVSGITGYEIKACDANGHYIWHRDTLDYGLGEMDTYCYNQVPIYADHTIFLPLQHGLIALNEDGSLKWKILYDKGTRVFAGPDEKGNIYLRKGPRIISVSPDGNESLLTDQYNTSLGGGIVSIDDGLIYGYQKLYSTDSPMPGYPSHDLVENGLAYSEPWEFFGLGNRTLDRLDTVRLDAYDIRTGNEIWNYTLPLDVHEATLNKSNYRDLVIDYAGIEKDNSMPKQELYRSLNLSYDKKAVLAGSFVYPIAVKDKLYINFWTYNYEVPTIFDESKCAYAGGIYAIDKNGSLIWSKSTGSRVTSLEEHNGTIYYGTNDGKISATRVDAAVGFALTAAFYLFVRFLLAGAVTRARSLVDKNEKRNSVLKYIAVNPGASLYDISKELKMNMGTVRYHLMILGINHRIVSFKADDKYVRYFTNAGSYSREQQFIVSMMRREGIRKVLNLLLERPGMSNIELSREIGMQESAASRYMKELVEKGVVIREQVGDGRSSYSIKNEYQEPVSFAMERLNNF